MPTECKAEPLAFQEVGRRAVVAQFTGGALTSDGGAVLLREVERTTGILGGFAACFRDYRDPARVHHSVAALVRQRIYALALGYEDLNDHDRLRHDPLFALLAEADDLAAPLAGKSTLNRLELSAATVSDAERYKKIAVEHAAVDRLLVDVFLAAHPVAPDEIVLDLDATDDPVHGHQEGRFFHGFYGGYCYLPLYIFAGEHLLCARLRSANIDASAGAREEVERIVAQIRTAWPTVRITLRADSGFCRDALLTWCETHAVDYVIGLAKNTRLTALIADELTEAEARYTATRAAARVFADLTYQTHDSWSRERRVVAKAEHLAAGDGGKCNPRFVVTSLAPTAIDARTLYEDLYCARGEMENRIKEQQLMLFADRTSAATMRANQLRLYCSSIAYLLLHALRRVALVGTALARAQCHTIRLTLLKVGARIRVTTRKVWLALASGCPHAALFAHVHATLVALPRRC
jgi:DDE family transposase